VPWCQHGWIAVFRLRLKPFDTILFPGSENRCFVGVHDCQSGRESQRPFNAVREAVNASGFVMFSIRTVNLVGWLPLAEASLTAPAYRNGNPPDDVNLEQHFLLATDRSSSRNRNQRYEKPKQILKMFHHYSSDSGLRRLKSLCLARRHGTATRTTVGFLDDAAQGKVHDLGFLC
jgi:hypothetical protein